MLELIENEKLSISEISLSKVTDDYIAYVKSLGKIDPESLAEFLVIAAHLILIKSRSLLPSLAISEEDEASIEDLTARLAEYQKIREVMKELRKIEGERHIIFTREAYQGMEPVFYPPPRFRIAMISEAFMKVLVAIPRIEKLAEEKIKKILSLEDKIKQIRSFLQERVEKAFSELTRGAKEKVEIIVSFLAILELARQRFVELDQKRPFEDITIKRL